MWGNFLGTLCIFGWVLHLLLDQEDTQRLRRVRARVEVDSSPNRVKIVTNPANRFTGDSAFLVTDDWLLDLFHWAQVLKVGVLPLGIGCWEAVAVFGHAELFDCCALLRSLGLSTARTQHTQTLAKRALWHFWKTLVMQINRVCYQIYWKRTLVPEEVLRKNLCHLRAVGHLLACNDQVILEHQLDFCFQL